MLESLKSLLGNAEDLSRKKIKIKASGSYPTGVDVSKVAKWQNDGIEGRIEPSEFVERAEKLAGYWDKEIEKAIVKHIDGDMSSLLYLGSGIASDISKMCDRVDTEKLKKSFEAKIDGS